VGKDHREDKANEQAVQEGVVVQPGCDAAEAQAEDLRETTAEA
jgi:hypothetical protein